MFGQMERTSLTAGPKQRQPDVAGACSTLIWSLSIQLRGVLAKTIADFERLPSRDCAGAAA
jgi:hypothetical protein